MKTSEEWAPIIIAFLQKNPVKTLTEATAQIRAIVEMVQEDCGVLEPLVGNDNDPEAA